MNAKTILSLLLLTSVAGCVAPASKTPTATGYPPMPPTLAESVRTPRASLASAPVTSTFSLRPSPGPGVTSDGLLIRKQGDGVIVSWPTNLGSCFLIYSTNLFLPRPMWVAPRQKELYTTNQELGRVEMPFTNNYSQCFFSLVCAPTGSLALAWSYDFSRNDNVSGFVLYNGASSRNYTNRIVLNYPCLWTITARPYEGPTNYYTVTAQDAYGIESEYSNEETYVP